MSDSLADQARVNLLADLAITESTESNVDLFRQSSLYTGDVTPAVGYWNYLESLRP